MAAQVVDIEALLKPISDELPSGKDPRSDTAPGSLYYRTKDARNAARSIERAAIEIGSPPPKEWDIVLETACEILAGHAKDLEIASWLIEALVRRHGFAGLRDGLRVLEGIVSGFWAQCFPELDEDGVEAKVSSVTSLSGAGAIGTLLQPIRLTPLTDSSAASLSLWSYEQAVELEKIADPNRKKTRIDAGAVTMEEFSQSVAETHPAKLRETVEAVEECLNALKAMSAAFDAVAGADSPSISALRELLEETSSSIRHFAADKLEAAKLVPQLEEITAGDASVEGNGGPQARTGGYSSREDALAELIKIASYFRKAEPHSPISYTLEEAVRRARMTLPELLAELSEDPAHIQRILMAAGVRNTEPSAAVQT